MKLKLEIRNFTQNWVKIANNHFYGKFSLISLSINIVTAPIEQQNSIESFSNLTIQVTWERDILYDVILYLCRFDM